MVEKLSTCWSCLPVIPAKHPLTESSHHLALRLIGSYYGRKKVSWMMPWDGVDGVSWMRLPTSACGCGVQEVVATGEMGAKTTHPALLAHFPELFIELYRPDRRHDGRVAAKRAPFLPPTSPSWVPTFPRIKPRSLFLRRLPVGSLSLYPLNRSATHLPARSLLHLLTRSRSCLVPSCAPPSLQIPWPANQRPKFSMGESCWRTNESLMYGNRQLRNINQTD